MKITKNEKGVYCLITNVKKDLNLKIGALGKTHFKKGEYIYVGSAQNNLDKRIARHFSKNKKIRWHIDYLLASPYVEAVKAIYKKAGKEEECKIACLLTLTEEPVKGFGCSDCDCYSHLFRMIMFKDFASVKIKELNE